MSICKCFMPVHSSGAYRGLIFVLDDILCNHVNTPCTKQSRQYPVHIASQQIPRTYSITTKPRAHRNRDKTPCTQQWRQISPTLNIATIPRAHSNRDNIPYTQQSREYPLHTAIVTTPHEHSISDNTPCSPQSIPGCRFTKAFRGSTDS